MGKFTGLTGITYSGDDAKTVLLDDVFNDVDLNAILTVVDGFVAKQRLSYIDNLDLICNDRLTTTSQKMIEESEILTFNFNKQLDIVNKKQEEFQRLVSSLNSIKDEIISYHNEKEENTKQYIEYITQAYLQNFSKDNNNKQVDLQNKHKTLTNIQLEQEIELKLKQLTEQKIQNKIDDLMKNSEDIILNTMNTALQNIHNATNDASLKIGLFIDTKLEKRRNGVDSDIRLNNNSINEQHRSHSRQLEERVRHLELTLSNIEKILI